MIAPADIISTLTSIGVRKEIIVVFDAAYVLPDPDWITNDLSNSMGGFLSVAGITYTPELFDCNKFANTAGVIADWCWARTPGHKAAALAWGLFVFFNLELMGLHANRVAIHRNPQGNLYAAFYEPQPAPKCLQPVTLTQETVQSCVSCIFV